MKCPNCGQTLPANGVCYNCMKNETDMKRFGRGTGTLPGYIKYGPRRNPQRYEDPGPPDNLQGRKKKRQAPALEIQLLAGEALKNQRIGMNRFLQDIYRQRMLISYVLKRRRMNEAQIAVVRRQPGVYLCSLLRTLLRTWNLLLTPTQLLVLANYYSFNGEPAPTKDALGQKLNIPVDRVHAEWRKALFILRLPHNKRHIDRTIYNVAKKILASSGSKAGR